MEPQRLAPAVMPVVVFTIYRSTVSPAADRLPFR